MLHKYLGDIHDVAILEVNCGTGSHISEVLASKMGSIVCGIDTTPQDLAASYAANNLAIASHRCQIIEADPCALPFDDQSFDVVYSVNQSHTWKDRAVALAHIHRVLKMGGTFVLSVRIKGQTWLTSAGEELSAAHHIIDTMTHIGFNVIKTEVVECSSVSNEFWIKAQRVR